jgi:hypothetical protein
MHPWSRVKQANETVQGVTGNHIPNQAVAQQPSCFPAHLFWQQV